MNQADRVTTRAIVSRAAVIARQEGLEPARAVEEAIERSQVLESDQPIDVTTIAEEAVAKAMSESEVNADR